VIVTLFERLPNGVTQPITVSVGQSIGLWIMFDCPDKEDESSKRNMLAILEFDVMDQARSVVAKRGRD